MTMEISYIIHLLFEGMIWFGSGYFVYHMLRGAAGSARVALAARRTKNPCRRGHDWVKLTWTEEQGGRYYKLQKAWGVTRIDPVRSETDRVCMRCSAVDARLERALLKLEAFDQCTIGPNTPIAVERAKLRATMLGDMSILDALGSELDDEIETALKDSQRLTREKTNALQQAEIPE